MITESVKRLRPWVGESVVSVGVFPLEGLSQFPLLTARSAQWNKRMVPIEDIADGLLDGLEDAELHSAVVGKSRYLELDDKGKVYRPKWHIDYCRLGTSSTVGADASVAHQHVIDILLDVAYIRRFGRTATMNLILDLFRILDAESEVVQGLIDVNHADEVCGSWYYHAEFLHERAEWHRTVEHGIWALAGSERLLRLRGPYWGLYLGRHIAQRVDPDGSFEAEFKGLAVAGAAKHEQRHMRMSNGAVLLTMSDNPVELVSSDAFYVPSTVFNTSAWLATRLRARGLMW